jgi:hypothetical protein
MSLGSSRATLLAGMLACALGCAPVSDPEPAGEQQGAAFRVGERFPELVFPALDGARPVSLAEYRGRKVLLHIFASW